MKLKISSPVVLQSRSTFYKFLNQSGLNQSEVIVKSGISYGTFVNIMSFRTVKLITAHKIAAVLNCDVEELFLINQFEDNGS